MNTDTDKAAEVKEDTTTLRVYAADAQLMRQLCELDGYDSPGELIAKRFRHQLEEALFHATQKKAEELRSRISKRD